LRKNEGLALGSSTIIEAGGEPTIIKTADKECEEETEGETKLMLKSETPPKVYKQSRNRTADEQIWWDVMARSGACGCYREATPP
jgi:hypothetical protein